MKKFYELTINKYTDITDGKFEFIKECTSIGIFESNQKRIDTISSSLENNIITGQKIKCTSTYIDFDTVEEIIKFISDNDIKINGLWYGLTPSNFPGIENNLDGAYVSVDNTRYEHIS
jgi:hypothetical protein